MSADVVPLLPATSSTRSPAALASMLSPATSERLRILVLFVAPPRWRIQPQNTTATSTNLHLAYRLALGLHDEPAGRSLGRGGVTATTAGEGEEQNSALGLRELRLSIEAAGAMRRLLDSPDVPARYGAELPTVDAATLLRRVR
jgi:hypothetical protein